MASRASLIRIRQISLHTNGSPVASASPCKVSHPLRIGSIRSRDLRSDLAPWGNTLPEASDWCTCVCRKRIADAGCLGQFARSTHGRRHARIPPPPPRLPPRLPRPRRCRRLGPYAALLRGRITLVRAPRITHASHPEQEQEFLDIHEYVRNRYASPPAALGTTLDRPQSSRLIPAGSMQTLTWNDTISAEAQVRCIRGLD